MGLPLLPRAWCRLTGECSGSTCCRPGEEVALLTSYRLIIADRWICLCLLLPLPYRCSLQNWILNHGTLENCWTSGIIETADQAGRTIATWVPVRLFQPAFLGLPDHLAG